MLLLIIDVSGEHFFWAYALLIIYPKLKKLGITLHKYLI